MQKELLAFVILSAVCLFTPFISYSLPSDAARLVMIIFFLAPILWTISLFLRHSSSLGYRNARIAGAITCLIIPVFIFLFRNLNRLPPFFEGVEFSETRILAQSYAQQGVMNLPVTEHSPFFQTPYLLYVVSSITELSFPLVATCMLLFYFILIGFVGIYAAEVISSKANGKVAFLPYIVSFSLVSASSLMATNIAYRYIGSLILPLLVFFFLNRTSKSKGSLIVVLFLFVGITFGDPVSSLLMMPLFIMYSIFQRDFALGLLATGIPLSYISYFGNLYLLSWRTYFRYAWSGAGDFFRELLSGRVAERVLPWKRTLSISRDDSFVASVAYLSLILLAVTLCLFSLYIIWNKHKQKEFNTERGNSLISAATIYLLALLFAIVLLYVGASVAPEVSFSDVRTTLIGYSSFLLILLFASKTLLSKLGRKNLLMFLVVALLILSSFRIVYQAYPKSSEDPVLIVENNQLDLNAIGHAAQFLFSYYANGSILCDYKTGQYAYLKFIVKAPEKVSMLSASTTEIHADFLFLDVNGLKYSSSYVPSDVYAMAYDFGMNGNVIYDNGAALIFKQGNPLSYGG